MPDLSLCSEPDQVALCVNCKRNPENHDPMAIKGPAQSWMKPTVNERGCGSWQPMPTKDVK